MKKKRELVIKINLSNRWIYFLITLGILVIIGVGVYAYGTSAPSTFGHSVGELAAPTGCASNQFLQFDGTNWKCTTVTALSSCSISLTNCNDVTIGTGAGDLNKWFTCGAGKAVTGIRKGSSYQIVSGMRCCSITVTCA